MSELLGGWARELWTILAESGPWLLVGFVVAGYLKALIREDLVFRHLGRDDLRSVTIAALAGAPLPLCSCSVIPTAVALKKSGASKGATSAFLISTPETGVDSIGITWALLDPVMTIARPVAAVFTAIFSGAWVNLLVRRRGDAGEAEQHVEEAASSCCAADTHEPLVHEHEQAPPAPRGVVGATREALRYAFGPLLSDLTPSFIVGFLLSALIAALLPADFFREVLPGGFVAMLAMLVVGVPIYVCAAASTPVAAAMIAKGLEPGAALVLLLAGPATNLATIAVVRQFLGGRVLGIYLASIAFCSLLLGWMVNLVYAALGLAPESAAAGLEDASRGPLATLAGIALAALLVWKALELRLVARWGAALRERCAPLGIDPTSRPAKAILVLALLLLWGSTTLGVVRPGEVGFRLRFGEVVEVVEAPGLAPHLPWPLETLETVRADEVRGLRLGRERRPSGEPDTLAALTAASQDSRAEVVTGDENVLRVAHSVQWRISDAWRSRYATEAPEELLRALAGSTLARAVARRTTDELLVGDRDALEAELASELQAELDALEAGLEVVAVRVGDVHAPPEVHDAYRDVASALEDRERQHRRAERYQKELVAKARADAHGRVKRAEAHAGAILERARGDTGAFLELLAAQAPAPELFRLRLRLEAAERALEYAELVLLLDGRIEAVMVERRSSPGDEAATSAPRPWREDE